MEFVELVHVCSGSRAGIGTGAVRFQASTNFGVNSSARSVSPGLELVGEA